MFSPFPAKISYVFQPPGFFSGYSQSQEGLPHPPCLCLSQLSKFLIRSPNITSSIKHPLIDLCENTSFLLKTRTASSLLDMGDIFDTCHDTPSHGVFVALPIDVFSSGTETLMTPSRLSTSHTQ